MRRSLRALVAAAAARRAVASVGGSWNASLPASLAHYPGLPQGKHPSILIIGMAKCGTTGLHGQIVQTLSSDLVNTPLAKELNFLRRPCKQSCLSKYYEWLNVGENKPFTIDGSPGYVHVGGAAIMANLQQTNPEAGVILLLREPVKRARSMFNFMINARKNPWGAPSRTFEDLVTFELELLEKSPLKEEMEMLLDPSVTAEKAQKIIRGAHREIYMKSQAAGHSSYERRLMSPLLGSLYLAYVIMWRKHFATSNALIVDSDYFFHDPVGFSRDALQNFLLGGPDAPGKGEEERQRLLEVKERWHNRNSEPPGHYVPQSEMPPALACRLQRYYTPYSKRTRELLREVESMARRAFVVPSLDDERAWWQHKDWCEGL